MKLIYIFTMKYLIERSAIKILTLSALLLPLTVLAEGLSAVETEATTVAAAAEPTTTAETYHVDGIYFFGCDGGHVDEIKASLPIHVGDEFLLSDMKKVKQDISNAVWQTIRCFPTDSAIITNNGRAWTVYIGLPGRNFVRRKWHPFRPG